MRSKVQLVCVSLSSRSLSSGEFNVLCLRGPTDRNVSLMFAWINAARWHFHMSDRKEFFQGHSAGPSKLAFWSKAFTYVTRRRWIVYVSLRRGGVRGACEPLQNKSFRGEKSPGNRPESFVLKGKSKRNTSRYALISENDPSLIVPLHHPPAACCRALRWWGPKHEARWLSWSHIGRVMHPEWEPWLIYENHLRGTSAAQKWSFHERGDHPYQFLKLRLLTQTWLIEVMQRPW